MNEESKDADKVPGRAALLTVTSILATYLLLAVATQMYAGVGDTGLGLNNPETSENVLGSLAAPVLGQPLNLLLFLAVLASSAASLMTTFLPTTRTMLAMGRYGALPERFATIHPKYQTPSYATVVAAVVAGLFYSVLTVVSENVLLDTIYSLGIMICFYYGLTAFACIWYFKGELFGSRDSFVFKFLAPLLGGIVLVGVLLVTLRDSASPDYGSGASIGGVGLVLILGLGLILVGVFLMAYLRRRHPAFFRGETLRRDTPAFVAD